MGVVEGDQILQRLRIARGRIRCEVRGDIALELAEERRELGPVGRLDGDPSRLLN